MSVNLYNSLFLVPAKSNFCRLTLKLSQFESMSSFSQTKRDETKIVNNIIASYFIGLLSN